MGNNSKIVEVVFKGERRAIYRNRNDLEIDAGDTVIVEADRGEELGRISLVGALVKLKRGKGETRGIIRKAVEKDFDMVKANEAKEQDAYKVCKQKIKDYNLDMKLIDVEIQFDGSKITFFFTAAQRVDFRELVKGLASVYRTRIELRQIGVRDEAKRISGFGICGCKQCSAPFSTSSSKSPRKWPKTSRFRSTRRKFRAIAEGSCAVYGMRRRPMRKCLKLFPRRVAPVPSTISPVR